MNFSSEQPAFLVGVTGYMELDDADGLKSQVRRLFRFLKWGPKRLDLQPPQGLGSVTLLESLLWQLVPHRCDRSLNDALRQTLAHWPGLEDTPIVILSSLAPGADSLVAEVALETEFQQAGFSVRAPLPYPADEYVNATTFDRSKPGQPDSAKETRQAKFQELLSRIRSQSAVAKPADFDVKLVEDIAIRSNQPDAGLPNETDADLARRLRYRRYYGAGEYIAVYSHLLIAIWDGQPDGSPCGTSAIVHARLRGPQPGVLPTTQGLSLPQGGPLFHIVARNAKPKTIESASNAKPADVWPPPPTIRFLHPHPDLTDEQIEPPRPDRSQLPRVQQIQMRKLAEWQREWLSLFCRIAQNLNTFNRVSSLKNADADKEYQSRTKSLFPSGEF